MRQYLVRLARPGSSELVAIRHTFSDACVAAKEAERAHQKGAYRARTFIVERDSRAPATFEWPAATRARRLEAR